MGRHPIVVRDVAGGTLVARAWGPAPATAPPARPTDAAWLAAAPATAPPARPCPVNSEAHAHAVLSEAQGLSAEEGPWFVTHEGELYGRIDSSVTTRRIVRHQINNRGHHRHHRHSEAHSEAQGHSAEAQSHSEAQGHAEAQGQVPWSLSTTTTSCRSFSGPQEHSELQDNRTLHTFRGDATNGNIWQNRALHNTQIAAGDSEAQGHSEAHSEAQGHSAEAQGHCEAQGHSESEAQDKIDTIHHDQLRIERKLDQVCSTFEQVCFRLDELPPQGHSEAPSVELLELHLRAIEDSMATQLRLRVIEDKMGVLEDKMGAIGDKLDQLHLTLRSIVRALPLS